MIVFNVRSFFVCQILTKLLQCCNLYVKFSIKKKNACLLSGHKNTCTYDDNKSFLLFKFFI